MVQVGYKTVQLLGAVDFFGQQKPFEGESKAAPK
jgi:hypothetical protein